MAGWWAKPARLDPDVEGLVAPEPSRVRAGTARRSSADVR